MQSEYPGPTPSKEFQEEFAAGLREKHLDGMPEEELLAEVRKRKEGLELMAGMFDVVGDLSEALEALE